MDLRVMSYNVRGFRAGVAGVAAVLREVRPDLVLMQECGWRWHVSRTAGVTGMQVAAGSLWPLTRTVRNAVLVAPPWRVTRFRLHRFGGSRPFYPRGALVAEIRHNGLSFTAVSIHLGLAQRERRRHARELTDSVLPGLAAPVVVGGDLNEGPTAPAARRLRRHLRDVWTEESAAAERVLPRRGPEPGSGSTFPTHAPAVRIDYILVSDGVQAKRVDVVDGSAARRASDHLPVVADLVLAE